MVDSTLRNGEQGGHPDQAPASGGGRIRGAVGRLTRTEQALVGLAVFYLLVAVAPLGSLFVFAPVSSLFRPEVLRDFGHAIGLTLYTSLAATGAALVLGLPTALALAKLEFRGKRLASALIELPIALPPLVMGVALILVWGRRGILGQFLAEAGWPLSFTTNAVIVAQFVVASPFLVRIAKAAIEQVPRALEEASWTLGYSQFATYLRVTLPMAQRGVLAATLTCWARCMGEFGATVLFAGNFPGRTRTVPLAIFSAVQYDLDAAVGLALIMVVFSTVAFVIAQRALEGT